MKISLVVSTYNTPEYLKKVLEGIKLQTERPYEALIADDGSGPETAETVERCRRALPFPVVHLWQEDRGFRAAKIRNEAIKKSSGDYIIALDGDCVPERHFISDHAALARKGFFFQGKRMLLGRRASASFEPALAQETGFLLKLFLSGGLKNAHHLLRLPFMPGFSFGGRSLRGTRSCNMGFFREDLMAVNGFNEDFVGWGREDSELAARLYKYGLGRKSHPFRALCFHLWHEENDRSGLEKNEELLADVLARPEYRCKNGISKLGS